MNIRVKHSINGGLNQDNSPSVLLPNEYRNLLNFRVLSEDGGNRFSLQDLVSNRVVSVPWNPADNALATGGIVDWQNSRLFFFVQNTTSFTNSGIYCYRQITQDIVKVLVQFDVDVDAFGLSNDRRFRVNGIGLAGSNLYWTDDLNQQKMIDVDRGMFSYDGTHTYPDGSTPIAYDLGNISEYDITLIRPQPQKTLNIIKKDSTVDPVIPDQVNNFVGNNSFQFCYRFVYRGNRFSTPSMFSYLSPHNNPSDTDDYDTIEVIIPFAQSIPYEVQAIEILMRTGNSGSFSIIQTWNKNETIDQAAIDDHNAGGSPLTVLFYNQGGYPVVSDAEAYKPFDSVPVKSKGLEIARNRVHLANNTIGYDVKRIDMQWSVLTQTGGTGVNGTYIFTEVFCSNLSFLTLKQLILIRVDESNPAIDGYYLTSFDPDLFNSEGLPTSAFVSINDRTINLSGDDDQTLSDHLFGLYAPLCPSPDQDFTVDRTYTGTQPEVFGLTTSGDPIADGALQLKSGSRYRGGIVFYDGAGRHNGAYSRAEFTVITPFRAYAQVEYDGAVRWFITGNQNLDIPEWATEYAVVRTRNLTYLTFIQHLTDEIKYVSEDADGAFTYADTFNTDTTKYLAWDISRLSSDKLGYIYQEGDLMNVVPNDDSTRLTLRVENQVGKYVFTSPQDIGTLNAGGIYNPCLIEIYTPYRESDENELLFEVGEKYPVLNAGTSSRAFSTTSGTMRGDVYLKQREISPGVDGAFEAMNPNDEYFSLWHSDIGRAVPQSTLEDGQKVRGSSLVWSNTYIPDTAIDGTNSFDALDIKNVDDVIGDIQKLILAGREKEDGTIMLVIGSTGTASAYLGETQFVDNTGQNVLGTSGNIIGTINVLRGNFGTYHPESVAENDGRVYWFDARKGAVVQYAGNALFDIASRNMRSYFNALGRFTMDSAYLIVGGFDEYNAEYLLAVPDITEWEVPQLADVRELIYDQDADADGTLIGTASAGQEYFARVTPIAQEEFLVDFEDDELVDGDADAIATLTYSDARGQLYEGGDVVIQIDPLQSALEEASFTPDVDSNVIWRVQSLGGDDSLKPVNIKIWKQGKDSDHVGIAGSKTLAYSTEANVWVGAYSFVPQLMLSLYNRLMTFANGQLYIHDDETVRNTFYGQSYNSIVAFVSNHVYSIPKVFKGLAVEGNKVPLYTHIRIEDPDEQSSDLIDTDWETNEGIHYAGIFRDRISPNTGSSDPEINLYVGDDMRGQWASVSFEFEPFGDDRKLIVRFIDVGFYVSSGHTPVIANAE